MKKALVILLTLGIIAFLGWEAYRRDAGSLKEEARRPRRPAVAVETAAVQKGTIRDVGFFTGTLLPHSYFIVAPKIAGRLEKLMVNIGDPVKEGQLIAVLEDDEYRQQVAQAEAELEVAQANVEESRSLLDVAKREYERRKALRRKKVASESELDVVEAQYKAQDAKQKVALAQVSQKTAALKAAKVRLSYTRIRSSWKNGNPQRIVGERFVDEGAMLRANDPIVSIIEIASLTAVIYIIESDYTKVRVGQAAAITTDAFAGRKFSGEVVRLAPLLKETSRQARLEVRIPNPDRLLKPGMFVRVELQFAEHPNATLVPVNALAERQHRQGVFQVDFEKKIARFVPVEVGIIEGDQAEVLSPPLSGSVVTLGHHLLEDGTAVTLPTGPDSKPRPVKVKPGPGDA